ncbi:hypothetical protein GCM10022252_03320 [Streptosporangium oxazolinicum]|uniref:ABC3 transporter permease protein domain-containing protein n=1 Tax=Streptosporangium oxazolinicum TaxID=909287 RepID=A0ABP8A9S7_9ACTN
MAGTAVMALTAWSTHEDQHYDDFGSAMTTLAATMGGALLLYGLSPFVPWSLGILGRYAVRLPPPIRLAARDVTGHRVWTAPAIAMTMSATALAITVTIIAVATTAQSRAEYYPQVRPGALLVHGFWAEGAATVRAAIQHEVPGVPITQSERQPEGEGYFGLDVDNVRLPDLESVAPAGLIGDHALLRYLTGDLTTPYDEGRAVVVTAKEGDVSTVTIHYDHDYSRNDESLLTKTIPAVAVKPTDPLVEEIFLPAKVVRDLGYRLEPEKLIIDPSVHRTSAIEQERLAVRLGDSAITYVERGFQIPTEWMIFVAVAVSVALGGALAVTGRAVCPRSRRVLLRVGGGSTATLRLFAASRAGLGAACGTTMGAAAGCVLGLLLVWPMTASIEWEPMPRVAFDTPWSSIAALVIGLPILAAAVAGLAPPGMTVRSAPPDRPRAR